MVRSLPEKNMVRPIIFVELTLLSWFYVSFEENRNFSKEQYVTKFYYCEAIAVFFKNVALAAH